ncbi:MAG: ArsR/SmtB family transcription factor [Candidatus Xenobia bacterium]
MKKNMLPDAALDAIAGRFRALGEPMRLRILRSLQEGEKTVGQLVDELEAGQANVSKHLKVLLDNRIVRRRSEGTSAFYAIADPIIFKLCDLVCSSVTEDLTAAARALGLRVR